MQLAYNAFYKQYGAMRSNQIASPRVFPLSQFHFPLNSLYHFLDHRPGVKGPDGSIPYLKDYAQGSLILDHAESIHACALSGLRQRVAFRQVQRFSNTQVMEFQHQHKMFKYLHEPWKKDTSPQHLLIVNYNFPIDLYQYSDIPLSEYQQWADLEQTAWDNALQVSHQSQRHQYRFIQVPDVLPSLSTLNAGSNTITPNLLKILDQPEKWFILELWKWLKQDRSVTWWKEWSAKDFDKLNLIFQHHDRWCLINMGYWHSFFETSVAAEDHSLNHAHLRFKTQQLQKYLMRMLMQVQSQASGMDTEALSAADIEATFTESAPIIDESHDVDLSDDDTMDKELEVLEVIEKRAIAQKLSSGASHVDLITGEGDVVLDENHRRILADLSQEHDVLEQLKAQINEQAEYGLMSATDYKQLMKQTELYDQQLDPYGSGTAVKAFRQIDQQDLIIRPEETTFPPTPGVVDPSMLSCTTEVLDKKYIGGKLLQKDILNVVHHVQKAGVIVQQHDVEIYTDATGSYEQHRLKIRPIDGVSTVLSFRVPDINDDGEFTTGGIKYRARRQKVDVPIRKINDRTVVLASYYGKVFVQRSEKKAYDLYDWIARSLIDSGMTNPDGIVQNIAPADVFDNLFEAPRAYSGLAKYIKSVVVQGDYYTFDHLQRETLVSPETLAVLETDGRRLVGYTAAKEPLCITREDTVAVYRGQQWIVLGDLFTMFQLNPKKAPMDYIELKQFKKAIPLGVVLGYYLGLSRLLALLKVKPKVVETTKRVALAPDEWALVFKDQKLIFSRKDALAGLILSGFNAFQRSIRLYHRASFDQTNVYMNVLESAQMTARHIRELVLLDQLFVDPITLEVLKEMHEPVTFQGLLYRAGELLLTDYHPDLQDMRYKRIRSYERVAGAIYKELALSIRDYKNRNIRARPQLEMNPYAVWKNVSSQNDTAVKPPADINPLMYLKEKEAITISGQSGQDKDAVNKQGRAYHPSEMGTTSEATSDSGDVGINTYLSANPRIQSLRGMISPAYDPKQDGSTSLFSTQVMAAPGSDKDAAIRLMMVGIQHAHTVACTGYHQPLVRTGYEPIIAKRMGGMFGYSAPEDGKVVSVSDKALVVELASGKVIHVALGRQYGRSEGSTYPHDVISTLKPGNKFTRSQVIAYNPAFFEPDVLDPSTITWKSGIATTTAFMEVSQTFEDSSAISKALSEKLAASTTKVKSYTVEFNQAIRNMVKANTAVEPMDVLLIIEDAVTNEAGLFDDDTLQTLQKLSNHAPRAKVRGIVDSIMVYYHGDKADMSASLKALADQSDKRLADQCKAQNRAIISGRVNSEYRVEGTPLGINKAEIQIYITVSNGAGVGDKGVFANQMKSTFGEVMSYPVTTESGTPVDAIFSYRSITARIVTSPIIIGTTTTLLKVIGRRAVALYRGLT